jgi:phosphatidylglycerol---prolipoprotein diacylglyceryl transferase
MLPFIAPLSWQIGPITVQAFGLAVALAVWIGLQRHERRINQLGLDPQIAGRLNGWLLVGGIVGAHLFSVLLYFPDRVLRDPWLLLRVWDPISSFGGMLGGLVAAMLFFQIGRHAPRAADRLAYLDSIAFVFPFSLAIGRLGCALAHDHPGRVTSFPIALSLETSAAREFLAAVYAGGGQPLPAEMVGRGFFDLGLLECLFLSLVVVPLFWYWNRQRRPAGFYLMAFAALYLPVRFLLDTLRVSDMRWAGLTPAQWVAAAIIPVLPFFVVKRPSWRLVWGGVLLLGSAWACTAVGQ